MAEQKTAPSSRNPADNDTLAGLLRTMKVSVLKDLDDCLPAKALAFVRATARATIQPLIQMVTTAGERVSRAQVASIPVYQMGAGGFVISFPVKAGDTGYLKACDRDVSLFLQGGRETQPNTKRMHSFEDGLFLPSVLSGFTVAGEDQDNLVIQTLDGSVRIALWPDKIKITGRLEVEGEIIATGNVTGSGINLVTHHHTGVQTGSSNTGGPV